MGIEPGIQFGRLMADEGKIMSMYQCGIPSSEIATQLRIPEHWVTRTIKGNLDIWEKEDREEMNWKVDFYAVCRSIKRKVRKRQCHC